MSDKKMNVQELDLNDILPNRFQPRIKFNEDLILELSESVKEHGVIQPIIVRPIDDKFEIVAGERRFKASALAGLNTIPAIVLNLEDKESIEYALLENVQREDLSAIEEAITYKKILDMGYITQIQLAQKLGKSQSAIANKLRLLKLCDEVQEALMEKKISERHARSLLKIDSFSEQRNMLYRIIKEKLTVRQLDNELSNLSKKDKIDNKDEDKKELINNKEIVSENLGTLSAEKINEEDNDTNEEEIFIENKNDYDDKKLNNKSKNELLESEKKLTSNDTNITYDLSELFDRDKNNLDKDITANDESIELSDKKEENDNMINNGLPTGGRFFNTNIESEEKKKETKIESQSNNNTPVFDFVSGKVISSSNSTSNTSNNIFTGKMEDLLVPKNSTNFSESDIDSNQDKIFLIESNKNNVFNIDNSNNDSKLVSNSNSNSENYNSSIFGDLMRKEENESTSDNFIDKKSLEKFLNPAFVDGIKKEEKISESKVENPIFSKFTNSDSLEINTPSTISNVQIVKEEKSDPVFLNPELAIEREEKPDLLAPMGSNINNNSINNIKKPNVDTFAKKIEEETQSIGNKLTPDTSIEQQEIEEERSTNIIPQLTNDDENRQPIFVHSSFDKEELSAPKTPIITNTDMSNLLSKPIEVDKTVVERDEEEKDDNATIAETANIPTTNNNFMTSDDIQPIIITDYNKQYDPILPVSNSIATPTIDFKHILNLIRNLSDEIEGYGYKIETDEIDLENNYQVIFNIEKK